MFTCATKFRRVKRFTRAFTRHHRSTTVHHSQLLRTVNIQIRHTAGVLALAGTVACRFYADADVVTIDEADVIEVLITVGGTAGECEFR
ncbi:hypothetical protein Hanom_Chr12g01161161 [Helianthus anomalus]